MKAARGIGILAVLVAVASIVACGGSDEREPAWTVQSVEGGYVLTDPSGEVSDASDVNLTFSEDAPGGVLQNNLDELTSIDKMRNELIIICDECHMDGDVLHCTGCRIL